MLDGMAFSGLGASGSEARDMLSGETVVGGVELRDAELDSDMSDTVLLAKLDPHRSESSSATVGGTSVAAIAEVCRPCGLRRDGDWFWCK
jgi:hypothetical protein